jgi:predicted dehydrogenase
VSARLREAVGTLRPTRLGFVGLGWIGRNRLDAIAARPDVEVAALHDVDPARLDGTARAYEGAVRADAWHTLLAADLDGIVIATPNGCHAEQAIAALERKLPVFCQKPLALDGAQARAVVAAAERADRLLGVDYSYRHVQGMDELRRSLRDGRFGDLLAIDLTFHNAYGPDKAWCHDRTLAGGGCLLDLGVHLVDLALWLQDELDLAVVDSARFAQGRRLPIGDAAIEDLAFATFRAGNGAIVRLACSWHAQSGCDAIIGARLFGTCGGAVWRNVGGSFFDFELDFVHGPKAERVAGPPDDWGSRALGAWVDRLRIDPSFDAEARCFVAGADLIDRLYSA